MDQRACGVGASPGPFIPKRRKQLSLVDLKGPDSNNHDTAMGILIFFWIQLFRYYQKIF